MRKIKLIMLCFSLFLSITSTTFAATEMTESVENSAEIMGGDFTVLTKSVVFPSVKIDTSKIAGTVSTTVNQVIVDDTGKGEGWIFGVSSTPLVSKPIKDKTVPEGTYTVTIPTSQMSVTVWSAYLYMESGMLQDPVHGPIPVFTGSKPLTEGTLALVKADPGYGMGRYMTDMQFSLDIPKQGNISNVTNPNSSLKEGEATSLVASEFSATYTYILSSGL